MRNFIAFAISVVVVVGFINYFNNSSQVKKTAIKSEVNIKNAAESFLDMASDKGAITSKDYVGLQNQLMATGGAFDISITVTRLYPVPVKEEPEQYQLEYRPAYGWSTSKGGMANDYVDPNWQSSNKTEAPKGVQYLVKSDNIALVIKQTDAMSYQRTLTTRMNQGTKLGEWAYAKSVRSTGNSITGNQQEPIE